MFTGNTPRLARASGAVTVARLYWTQQRGIHGICLVKQIARFDLAKDPGSINKTCARRLYAP